jgi:hypothetical protein
MPETTAAVVYECFFKSFQASDWIALSSVVIALCVFFITLWQAWFTRQHSIISVRPFINLIPVNNPDLGSRDFKFETNIRNMGLGPAQIHKVHYFIDGELCEGSSTAPLEKIGLTLCNIIENFTFLDTIMLSANNSICLISINTPIENREVTQKNLDRIDLLIEYQDMYGNPQKSIDTRKLKGLATQAL